MNHEYKSGTLTENGVEQWAVFERCFTAKWLVIARCPDERCAFTIVAHMNASIQTLREKGHERGASCVAVCSVNGVCDICCGSGMIGKKGNTFEALCPNAVRKYDAVKARKKIRTAA